MKTKEELIETALTFYEVKEALLKKKKYGCKVTYDRLFTAIIDSGQVPLKDSLKGQATSPTIANLTKSLFPDKPRDSTRLDTFLMLKVGYKYCPCCQLILEISEFRPNSCKTNGLNGHCRECQSIATAITQPDRQAKYRAAKLNRTPSWADLDKIKEFYDKCPSGFTVDHIIPLQGILVSGLHVENNLQYLTANENSSKRNNYKIY